jgi:hypothetical protein
MRLHCLGEHGLDMDGFPPFPLRDGKCLDALALSTAGRSTYDDLPKTIAALL